MRRIKVSGVTSGRNSLKMLLLVLVIGFYANFSNAQCDQVSGTISGNVNLDGKQEGISNILVKAFNGNGELVAQEMSDFFGNFALSGLQDGGNYRVEFVYGGNYEPALVTEHNASSVQFVSSPACNVDFALVDPANFCAENGQIALTCFVRGGDSENAGVETIVYTDYNFAIDSEVKKYASKAQTGSVWGLAWRGSSRELFSSAFVKQYAGLSAHGHGAIFKTKVNTGKTKLFARLDQLGQEIGTLVGQHNDVNYGSQVGKMGLGALEISEDESTLYVINIYNNTLVELSATNPVAETTKAYSIPDPGCVNGDSYRAFALTKHEGKLYVGVTCTSFESGASGELSATVFEFDPSTGSFAAIFSTNYPKGYWKDTPANSLETQAWLTDLAFTDEGNMILSLSDRIAHRFANNTTNGRLDDQHPDILLAYNENGTWKLEKNAQAGALTGSHPNSGEGPGNGEFFGYDYWISGPQYHSEIATGSVMVLPGDGSVVATVFDPDFDSYTGGLHKYSTTNGDKLGTAIVYEHSNDPLFGKASGLGDMVSICSNLPLEIGNYLWLDDDKDGIQDAGEQALAGIEVSLFDSDCALVGTTTTDNNGNYYFNDSNVDLDQDGLFDGLDLVSNYSIVITDASFDVSTGILNIDNNPYVLTKNGVGFGTNPERNDSDAFITNDHCDAVNGRPFIGIQTGSAGASNHDYDFGFSPAEDLDLALRKELVSNYAVQYGDTVLFKITVFNQGGVVAHEVVVNDYLTSGYHFEEAANPGWKLNNGIAQTLIGSPLTPGSNAELFIKLVVVEGAEVGELANYAEISAVLDASGENIDDIDSTPDDIVGNDNGGNLYQATDDEIFDDGTIDEDDHDPAAVRIFDLALRKVLLTPEAQVFPNSSVEFAITVYNQGSVTAKEVTISDYMPAELIFNPDINEGWTLLDNSTITYVINEEIVPQSSKTINVILETGNINPDVDVINYAEIRSAIDEFDNVGIDVDSEADGIRNNDVGGSPYDATDNEVNDHGSIDEDDHDPALLNFSLFDLALIKTTLSSSVKAGSNVTFNIEIVNQGDVAAKKVGIVDYIPAGLTLNDPEWQSIDSKMAKFILSVPGGLQPGENASTEITFSVDEDFAFGTLVNFAEIDFVYGMDDNDLSRYDIDSSPDDQQANDVGGLPGGPTDNQLDGDGFEDEDDHDPAYVYVYASLVDESCICLENADVDNVGQFGEIIEIIAPSGLEWYIEQVNGLFDAQINVGVPPTGDDYPKGMQYPLVDFMTGQGGYMLQEYPIGSTGNSRYYITGLRLDGEDYSVVLRNNIGDQEIIEGTPCNYQTNDFTAPAGVCSGSLESFCVTDYNGGDSNEWTVSGDAVIVGDANGECVQIQFGTTVGSDVDIVFSSNSDNACYSPVMQTVTIGESGGSLSCLGSINVSLDNLCEINLTPGAILTSPVNPSSVYSVVYTTVEGWMLPDDVDWSNYIDREVVAKVMDNCSGNSCWSFITIEDKTAPEIECFDLTVSCIEMMDYNPPFVLDNCFGEATLIPTGQTNTALECDPDFTYVLTRSFKAKDDLGNMSDECIQTITIERPDFDAIVGPDNFIVENKNALSCNGFATIEGGVPDPAVYGCPTLEGQPLYPSSGQFCNLGTNYKDTVFPTVGCVTKIMRQWIVFEWHCDFGRLDTFVQIFNIADMAPPSITCGGDITVSTNSTTCFGTVNLPPAVISDDCTENPTVDITYPGGFLQNSNGGTISLPIGTHEVTYTVTDDCFNSSSCSIMVEVEDRTPPVAVCHQNTVLSVRNDGTTYAYASSFDDGSYDDCGFDRMEVRRMDGGFACGDNDNGAFSDRVDFCCADVGAETVVVLRIFDLAGNANQCMVNVQIQDKNPPSIVPPANITVDCEEVIELDDLSQFGQATATDNCMNTTISEEVISGLNECRTGVIERVFTASDGNGMATASQYITVITEDTFDLDNIEWPDDYETSSQCDPGSLKPENLPEANAFPILNEGFCSQVGVNYSDKVFKILNSETSCQKIIRTWIVEDFCQPVDEGGFAFWRYDQVIEISNNTAPVITSNCDDITVCSYNDNCSTGPITLTAGATDDCTPGDMMRYSYFIDFGNDGGEFDIQDSGQGDTVTVMGEYPLGTHSIIFRFSDFCGNSITCSQTFTIENCVGPTVVCIDGISVGLEPMDTDGDGEVDDEMAVVKARLFDASSFHPCGDDLIFSFSENPADSCKTFACDDIGINDVSIYAIDESGNVDFCVTTLDVQDNNQVDLCRGVEECIVMPVDITVNECIADFSPDVIGGGPTIDPECICTQTTIEYMDRDSSDVNNTCTIIVRDWKVTFTCGAPKSFTSTQVITKFNDKAPIVSCPENVTVNSSDVACEGEVVVGIPEVLSDCTTTFTITNNSAFANSNIGAADGTYPVGESIFNYIITDICENSSSCEVSVVVLDNASPICVVTDITVAITDSAVDVTVSADDIDNGSFDDCGTIEDRVLMPSVFGCDEAGTVQDVTLTITDDSGNSTDCFAQVTVVDSVPPTCVTRTAIINLFDDASASVPAAAINNGSFDECGELVEIFSNSSFDCDDLGEQIAILVLIDDSGNRTDCEAQVTVRDVGNPICILQPITVQLDGADQATISGEDIDIGSNDNCSGLDTLILDKTMFNCDDLGDNTVNVTAVDNAGNETACMTTVTVTANPMLMCIANDITIFLEANGEATITAEDIDGGSGIPCGDDAEISIDRTTFFCNDVAIPREVTLSITSSLGDTSCVAMVMVVDTIPPVINCPADLTVNCQDLSDDLSVYGTINTTGSNCVVLEQDISVDSIFNLNECGLGTVLRVFTAVGINGNMSMCTQTISVNNSDPFTEDDIVWPMDTLTIMQCVSIDPDSINSKPEINANAESCTNISIAYMDDNFTMNENCMDTVRRTWTVTDSCEMPPNVFTFEQILFISDQIEPVINVVDTLFLCDTLVTYGFTVADCNDVSINYTSTQGMGMGDTITGNFPEGNTTVYITASDRCGNTSDDSVVVNIVLDVVRPSITCINRNIVIEEDGQTVVLPSDTEWFFRVSDNTTDSAALMYSFNPEFDMSIDTLIFTCDSVIIKSHTIDIFVKDKGGNVTTCSASYVTTDPNDVCADGQSIIQGLVTTEFKKEVPDVQINLVNGDMYEMTNSSGFYTFPEIISEKVYELKPEKNTNLMDGVSSLDLVLIQRHILGTQSLNSSYQLIAADINKSGAITGKDLLDLKKNILGVINTFPNNQSWRFVDSDYEFVDAQNPFSEYFPESYMIYEMSGPVYKNFVGIKVGDVNGSIELNASNQVVTRNAPLEVQTNDLVMDPDSEFLIPITTQKAVTVAGLQLSFAMDRSMSVLGVESEYFDVNDSDYTISEVNGQKILKIVIIPQSNTAIEANADIINVRIASTAKLQLAKHFELDRDFNNEIYAADLGVHDVNLRFNDAMGMNYDALLLQNSPNPWKDKTVISFDLDAEQSATINVFTVTGALVTSIQKKFNAGRNEVELKASNFNDSGVFYYELVTDNVRISKRMILIK